MTYKELYDKALWDLEHNKITLGEFEKMIEPLNKEIPKESEEQIYKGHEVKVITRGNCMICGKKLTDSLFLCKECGEKANKESEE